MRIFVLTAALAGLALPGAALAQTSNPSPAPTTPSAPSTATDAAAAPAPATPAATPAPPTPPAPAAPASAPSRWRGSLLFATLNVGIDTIFPGTLDYPSTDPAVPGTGSCASNVELGTTLPCGPSNTGQVTTSVAFRPRYFLDRRTWQLRGGLTFNYEVTDSARTTTTTAHEPRFTDPFVQLWYHGIPAFADFKLWVAATMSFPLSPESRARTTIVTPGLLVQVARGFEHVLGGDFAIIANVSYTHPFYRYTTPETRADFPYGRQCADGGTSCRNQLSGLTNPSDTLSWSLILTQDWGWISPGVFYSMSHGFSYTPTAVSGVPASPNDTRIRQSSVFAAWVDFIANSWFTAEVGYQVVRSVLDSDGTYGNPFYSPEQSTAVYLQTIFTLDKLYQAVFVGGGGEGGVIRTRNNTPPRVRQPFGVF